MRDGFVFGLEQLAVLLPGHALHQVRVDFTDFVKQKLVGGALFDLATACDWGRLSPHQFLSTVNDAALQEDCFLQVKVASLD